MKRLQNIADIDNFVKNYQVVSFDIFDTLLFRNVPKPTDVFIVAQELAASKGVSVEDFLGLRIRAEKQAAEKKLPNTDTTLDSIYSELPLGAGEREILKSCELEAESHLLVANAPMIQLANRLKDAGKTVIAVSDMYLDGIFLQQVLEKNGFTPDKLYVSSEVGLRKSRGELFDHVLRDLNIDSKHMVHVGDNRLSDGVMPNRYGVDSVFYSANSCSHLTGTPSNASELVMHTLASKTYKRENISFESVGYSFLGPLLVGMCQWIHDEHNARPDWNIHFLARDGYVVHGAYSIMYPQENARYSYVSRRSLTVPLLSNAHSFKEVIELVPYIKRRETIGSLFEKIGLEGEDLIEPMKEKYGNDISRVDLLAGKYDDMFQVIEEQMHANAEEEKACMEGYLSQEFEGNSVFVDIGWYGTIQSCLQRATQTNSIGLYLGLLRHEPEYCLGEAKGYAYDYVNGDEFDSSLVFSFNGLAETFFTAPHGSVKRYEELADGTYGPVFADKEIENEEAVLQIHNAALSFVHDYVSVTAELPLNSVRSSYAFANLERLLTMPTKREVGLLGNLWFYDASYDPLVCFEGKASYFKNPKKAAGDFLRSNWKAGFLAKLFGPKGARRVYTMLMKVKGA